MGRYFLYHMHPLSVAELAQQKIAGSEVSRPQSISTLDFERLERFGGFPEPFLKHNMRFFNRWKRTRLKLKINAKSTFWSVGRDVPGLSWR